MSKSCDVDQNAPEAVLQFTACITDTASCSKAINIVKTSQKQHLVSGTGYHFVRLDLDSGQGVEQVVHLCSQFGNLGVSFGGQQEFIQR